MFESGYTPGSIANLLSGKKDEPSGESQTTLFSKHSRSPNKAIQEHRKRTRLISDKLKEQTNQKNLINTKDANKDKLKVLKSLTTSTTSHPKEDRTVNSKTHGRVKRTRKEQRERTKKIKTLISSQNKCTVFVGNLPNTMKKKGVVRLFREHGNVESIRFRSAAPANPKMPKKGIVATGEFHPKIHTINAYVVFKDTSAAESATKLNGFEIEEHHIRVDYLGAVSKPDHKRSIFVGNLPFDTKEEDLREHFKDIGDIENVRLIKDNLTRLGKGFGYILFKDKDSVMLAQKLNGSKFNGRKIRVQMSTSTTQASDGKKKLKTAQQSNPKKRKRPDSHSADSPHKKKEKVDTSSGEITAKKMKRKIKRAAKLAEEGGQPKFRSKEKQKKKLRHRLEKKKKQKLANILTGNKNSDFKKRSRKEKNHSRQGQEKGKHVRRKPKSKA